jgi:branched-chain amino acid transport system permease protein
MSQDLTFFLQNLFNGLSISGIYILVGVGFTLVFGLTHLINFAHGQFIVLGAFIGLAIVTAGVPYWFALLAAGLVLGVIASSLDLSIFRRNIDRPLNGLIVSLGLVIVIEGVVVRVWGVDPHAIPSPLGSPFDLGGIRITQERLMLLGVSAILIAGVFYILRRTDLGRTIRAVAENRYAAALLGVNVSRTITMTFFVGSGIAGVAGALLGIIFPFTPFFGGDLLLKGIAVALIGGMGSVEGAVVAGLLLGMVETFGSAYGIDIGIYEFGPTWRDGYAFILMIAIMLWRPRGLFRGTDPRFI